jgi:tRNA splicing endonuclease
MLYMVIERFKPDCAEAVYRRFRDRGRMAPDGLRYLSSWVDFEFGRCFQVMEADDETLLAAWIAHWDDLVDFEVVPVRTSSEAAAAMAGRL